MQKARQAAHNFKSFEGTILVGALLISAINVLQAWVGAALVRRVLGKAPALTKPGAIVAFLCSEQAGFVTGHALPVDGGAVQALL